MYIPQDSPLVLHLPTSWQPAHSRSLPHMHVQRWDLAQIRTCNRTNRRRMRYYCASDPASVLGMLPQIPTLQQMCLHSMVQSEEASRQAKRMLTLRYTEACEFLGNVLQNTYFSYLGQPCFADDYITAFHVQTLLMYFQ